MNMLRVCRTGTLNYSKTSLVRNFKNQYAADIIHRIEQNIMAFLDAKL